MRVGVIGCAVLGFAATALGVEIEYAGNDPAVKFAVWDAKECLRGAVGRIVLTTDPSLAFQEWRLKTSADGALVVSGRDGMGIVYGVYSFLEKHAGCRWYAPDTAVLPDLAGWKVPAVDDRGRPSILDREYYVGGDYADGTWRLRNKETQRVGCNCGVFVGAPGGCHTFDAYSKAVAAAGKKTEGGEFCLTDPEVRHIVAERMKKYIREDRAACKGRPSYAVPSIYELSQNDGGTGFRCACADCQALYRAAGSWSGPNIAFASAVAEEVGREFPDVKVRTFAYSYTERPPTNVLVASDNLMIRYCRSFLFRPLTAETDNGRILRGWDEHVKDKQVWGYWRSYSGPLFPAVKPREDIGREMKFCRDMRVCGYFAEAESPMSRSFSAMQHWLFLKLAEDPGRDVFALADEFARAYYGPAAKPLLAYLDYLERRQKACYAKLDPKFVRDLGSGDLAMYVQRGYLDRDFFEKANGWLDEAERLAAGDERVTRHVAQERLVVDRSMADILQKLAAEGYSPDMRQVAARMRTKLPDLIRNWTSIPRKEAESRIEKAAFEATIAERLPTPVPPELKGRKYVEWQCDKLGGDNDSEIVKDADSVTGYARALTKAEHKLPYMAGLYDDQVRKDIGIRLEAKDIPQDGKFHLVKLGTFDIVCQSRVYFDWSWRYATWVPPFGVQTDRREVWLSVKLTGPTYVKGSTDKDGIFLERLFFAEPASPAVLTVDYSGTDKAVQFAANDLRRCLKGAVGTVRFAIDEGLKPQEWRIAGKDGTVTLYGRDGQGQVYAAYVFLEKYAGCRWYAPDTEAIPDRTGWILPNVSDRGRPAVLDREYYVGYDYMDSTWRLRNRETNRVRFDCGLFVGAPFACHTFGWYHDKIKDKLTPEMMGANAKGKPTGQFCPTHPEVRKLVAEQMRAFIREDRAKRAEDPAYTWPTIYELSQDDGDTGNECLCARCRPLYEAAGKRWSGPNLAFADAVAREIGKECPEILVRTFAYSYTELPPENDFRAADNVSARYCRSFLFQPLTAETDNGRILTDWKKHLNYLHVWSYWIPCSGPACPAVKPRCDIAEELRFCRDMNVYGYFAQSGGPFHHAFALMQHWLFLKFAEDPDQDMKKLSTEFMRAYYGKAAKPMAKYLVYLEKRELDNFAKVDPKFLAGVNSGNLAQYEQREYLDREFFETANRFLDEAERLAAGDARSSLHVGMERLIVDRTMRRRAPLFPGYRPDYAAAAERTAMTLPELTRNWCYSGKELEKRLKGAAREIAAARRYPLALPKELEGREVVQWPAEAMAHYSLTDEAVVDDPDSVTGVARIFPAAHQSLKPPFFAGAYDHLGKKGCEITLTAEQIPQDEKFHVYRLGTIRVLSPAYAYYNSWHYRSWLSTVGIEGEEREIWLSAKFTGPAYVKGSTQPNGVRYERVFYVTPGKEMK